MKQTEGAARPVIDDGRPHGNTLYVAGCRCDVCTDAASAASRANRERKRLTALKGHHLRRIRKLLNQAIEERGGCIMHTAQDARLPERTLLRVRTGEARYLQFVTADALVTNLYGPQKWTRDPVLRTYYDRIVERRPTTHGVTGGTRTL